MFFILSATPMKSRIHGMGIVRYITIGLAQGLNAFYSSALPNLNQLTVPPDSSSGYVLYFWKCS